MARNRILTRPIKNSALTFEDLYQEISTGWQEKAKKLQTRRWRMLKQEMRGGAHAAR